MLALYALAQKSSQRTGGMFFLAIAGTALFFGDAIITPAISVLSAVEGVKLVDTGAGALRPPNLDRHPMALKWMISCFR